MRRWSSSTPFLAHDADRYPVEPEYAAGLHQFLSMTDLAPLAVKGHVTGPVTWGLTVADDDGKGILYDDVLGDVVPKLLRLKAAWQEKALKQICRDTIIFVDEPYMSAFGIAAAIPTGRCCSKPAWTSSALTPTTMLSR
jgi:hypothetical protein